MYKILQPLVYTQYMKKVILLICTALLFQLTTIAQTPSAQQMQQLQNLSPEQLRLLQKQQEKQGNQQLPGNKSIGGSVSTSSADVTYDRDTSILAVYEQYRVARNKEIESEKANKVFGHDLFDGKTLTFAPALNVPTPANYTLASGDQLIVTLWGAVEGEYRVQVSPDGYVNINGVGLVNVQGQPVSAAEANIKARLMSRAEGIGDGSVNVNVSLGNIRSIKVNIAGEARNPGTYTIPSLATLFNALYVAGGVSEIGSLRNIKLYRKGKLISTLDVYDYLMKGKTEVNARLEDNDLIVVEPYENYVKITGQVKRPMVYELKANETIENILAYSGGFTGKAFFDNLNVARSATGREKQLFTIEKPGFQYFHLMDRDVITVAEIVNNYANRVAITGPVWREGYYELSEKTNTASKLIKAAHGIRSNAYLGRALLYRLQENQQPEITNINISKLLENAENDIQLRPKDSLVILSLDSMQQRRTIVISGEVIKPDTVQYRENMTLADAVLIANGLKESASLANVEVARRVSRPNATAPSPNTAELFTFKIDKDLSLQTAANNFVLMPFDIITVRKSPGYVEQRLITVEGEVVFDGQYALVSNAVKLSDIITKSGGFTPEANIKGAYLRRKKTEYDVERDRSVEKLTQTGKQTSKDTIAIETIKVGDYYSIAIDLEKAITNPGSLDDVILMNGDRLVVPTYMNTVKISGGVYYPNTVTYMPGKRVRDYISMAGGYSQRARRTPFIIYQNGMVSASSRIVEPGCEIVVPQKPERRTMSPGEWMSIGNSAISMAAMVTSLIGR